MRRVWHFRIQVRPQNQAIDRDALEREARLRRVQEAWLRLHHLEP